MQAQIDLGEWEDDHFDGEGPECAGMFRISIAKPGVSDVHPLGHTFATFQ